MILAAVEASLGPRAWTPAQRLDVEVRVRRALGGDAHYIASTAALERARLHDAIRAAVASGVSAAEAAERFGVSRQTVWRVTSRAVP